MTGRTRQCPEGVRAGRLKKAIEFHDAAALLEDDAPNAAVDLLVDAGIAAADAICCVRLGVHSAKREPQRGDRSSGKGRARRSDRPPGPAELEVQSLIQPPIGVGGRSQ